MIGRVHAKDIVLASVFTIIGLIAGPLVAGMLNDYISITPTRLVKLLESGNVAEFNNLRAQLNYPIILANLDLSNKDLSGVNLKSVAILRSLSEANLENSVLEDAQISGDLSNMNFRT